MSRICHHSVITAGRLADPGSAPMLADAGARTGSAGHPGHWYVWCRSFAGPGPGSQYCPLPTQVLETRAAWLQACRAARRTDAQIVANGREVKSDVESGAD